MTPHGFITDTDKDLKKYKESQAEEWRKILGGTDFNIIEENSDTSQITPFISEPE